MKIIDLKKNIEKILDTNKANNIIAIDLKKKTYIADYMIIASEHLLGIYRPYLKY